MIAAMIISTIAVIGTTAYAVQKFDKDGQRIIDNLKKEEKELFNELKNTVKDLVKNKEE